MADERYRNLPGVISTLEDGGLDVARPVDLGDSILIIGTAAKGPLNQPVTVQNLDDAKRVFGDFGEGTLVQGIFEATGVSNTGKDIRGMRIGPATKAELSLAELTNVTAAYVDNPTTDASGTNIQDAFVITALQEGDQYNGVTVRVDIVAGKSSLVFYNPDTGLESAFSFNYVDDDADVDVHNLQELEDAMAADVNLAGIVSGTVKDLTASFGIWAVNDGELDVGAGNKAWATGFFTDDDGFLNLRLNERLDPNKATLDATNGWASGVVAVPGYETHAGLKANLNTAGNNVTELLEVYDYAIVTNGAEADDSLNMDASGTYGGALISAKGKDMATLTYQPEKIDALSESYFANDVYDHAGDGWQFDGTPACRQIIRNGYVDIVAATGTLSYTLDSVYSDVDGTYSTGSETILYRTRGTERVTIPAAQYSVAWAANQLTFTLPATDPWRPLVGDILTADFTSGEINLTEAATKAAAEAAGVWTTYFMSGNRMYFGGTAPWDILATYRYKRNLAIGGDVQLVDVQDGWVKFPNAAKSPKQFMDLLNAYNSHETDPRPHVIGFRYKYLPEWADFTTTAQSLKGGGNGIDMTNAQLYDALDDAYAQLENYSVDIIVPMGAYLDATKKVYDEDTGTFIEKNAGFHTILGTLLDSLQEGVNETLGVMAVKPSAGKTLADVNSWYEKLTIIDDTDPFRAANIMATLDNKWISVTAMEPIFSNGTVAQPYISTAEAAYAGLTAGLDPQSATTNKRMDNIVGLRYRLTKKMLDALVGGRYVVGRFGGTPRGVVVVDGVSAAAKGSDYTRWSTTRIVKAAVEVCRQVAEPFIGEPNDAEQRAALDTAIRQGLQRMVEAHALQAYEFAIISTPAMQVNGEIDIDLVLVPAFEIRKVRVRVKLRPSL